MAKKISATLFGILLSIMFLPIFAHADMGAIVPYPIKVSEEAQKAIILHNEKEEVLILGTDLKAENRTSIVRFIPFPSEPKVSLANADVFKTASYLMKKYNVVFLMQYKAMGAGIGRSAIEIRLHKKIGAHDVTVIKINDISSFRSWVNNFFNKKGLPQKKQYPSVESIANSYVKRGINYFVFDFVEVTKKTRSVAPLAYRFESSKIYYPLITSNSFGVLLSEIDLMFVTPKTLFKPFIYNNKKYKFLNLPSAVNGAKGSWRISTSSYVPKREMKALYPKSNEFFKHNKHLIMQFVGYRGIYNFNEDIYSDFSGCSPYPTGEPIDLPPRFTGISKIFLNKPGIKLKTPSYDWIVNEKAKVGLDTLGIESKDEIPVIVIGKRPKRKIVRITSSVGLSKWFQNRECLKTWDSFHRCINKHQNPEDVKLYRQIEREFYSKLICQRGCEDNSFLKWTAHWYSPAYMTISAPIGEKGGFKTLKDAKQSLRKINHLLKKVVYGAKFPEDYGEGRSDMDLFSTDERPVVNADYSKAVSNLLNELAKGRFITGLSSKDIKKISVASKAGRAVLFVGTGCPSNPTIKQKGWIGLDTPVWVDFRSPVCPVMN